MEERDGLSLIYGSWVGFKSTCLSRPARQSQNSLHESSVGCLFCFPELNSKAPPPYFPSSLTISTVRKLLGPVVDMERRREGKKEGRERRRKECRKEGSDSLSSKKAVKEIYCGQKKKMWRIKTVVYSVLLIFSFLVPKMILTPKRKQPVGLYLSLSQLLTWQRLQH